MKRTVLVYGAIAGVIMSCLMFVSLGLGLADAIGHDKGMLVGYTTMVMGFLLVFFGIRSYRENAGAGEISFGRAFKVGILITLVASAIYVATWQVMYFGGLTSDYLDHYNEQVLADDRAAGATEAELAEKRARLERWVELYQNPIVNAGVTLLEPLPVGIIMTLVSAGILRRRRQDGVRERSAVV